MGKYSDLVKTEDEKPQEKCHPNALKLYLLAGIADELAEANRLKRIELRCSNLNKSKETFFDLKKELEDQA